MTRIAIVAPSLSAGDAIGNDILHMDQLLRDRQNDVRLFADHVGEVTRPCWPVSRATAFLGNDKSAVVVYHHSIACRAGVELIQRLRCRRVVRYHNVTPARFFEGLNASCAEDCRRGREQLQLLAHTDCDLYLSDSAFNQMDLIAEGAKERRCVVVPPFHLIDRLRDIPADLETLEACDDGRTNLLFVGRLAPNKGHAALIDAFTLYHRHYDHHSRLLLIGKEDERIGGYVQSLRERVKANGLDGLVTIASAPTAAVLKAYYLSARVFVIASEHEGFCVPLVEAMALARPVVGFRSSAIPETLETAGVLWEERSPWLLAESVDYLVNDAPVYEELQVRGRRRYDNVYTNNCIERRFLAAMALLN